MKAGISTTSGFDVATKHPSVQQGGKMKNIFRLYTKECRKVLCSLTFLLYTAAVFAMYYTQFHSELSGAETEPKPGLASYGITEREVPEILMPNALERLLWEYRANCYTAYPIGFYKEVHLMEKKRQKMADILCELTGWTHEELEHFGEEDDFKEGNNFEKDDAISFEIGSEDGIWQADDNNFVVGGGRNSVEKESSNLDDSVSENITVPEEFISENETAPQSSISGNETAPQSSISGNEAASESPISENETVPPSSVFEGITDSKTLLSENITYTRFRELMREADELIGGGSRYSDQYIVYNFSQVPKTYEEALAEYRQLIDEDKITGGYARLYCDYIGLMLGVLPVFVAVSLMQLDRKARMEQLIYSRSISSAKLIFTRYAALVTAMFLPIILTAAAAQRKVMGFYPDAMMDMFAFARYTLLWMLPTIMAVTAVGMLLTELASGLLAILLQGAWWFVGMFSSGLTGDIGKFNLTIRHNSLYQLDIFREEYTDFLFNRAFFAVLAILLVALTAFIYEEKRRGGILDLRLWANIIKVNLRHNFLPHLLAALAITICAPVVFEISSLNSTLAAQPLEMLLSLTGAILLTPIFLPEQDENIRDLIRSKRTDYLAVCALRIAYSTLVLAAILGGFTFLMRACESAVTLEHFFGAFASAFFLGALGFFGAGISGNVTVGYMVAMIYYIANFTLKDKLGNFYLFSMSTGNGEGKVFLLAMSFLVVAAVFEWKKIRE